MVRVEAVGLKTFEVETNNAHANALYRAIGFDPLRTFEYFRVGV